MGVGAAVFSSAGVTSEHFIPGVYSRRNTVGASTGISSGNLVILGQSQGGCPGKLLCVTDVAEAKDLLVGGDLLDGVSQAFTGSSTYIPQKVYCMRVNGGEASTLELYINDNNKIILTSTEYGAQGNSIGLSFKTEDNISEVTLNYKEKETTISDITRPSILLQAQNVKSALCTINSKGVQISYKLLEDADDAEARSCDFTFTDYQTLKNLKEAMEKVTDDGGNSIFSVKLLDEGIDVPSSALDYIEEKPISTTEAITLYSNTILLIKMLKTLPYIQDVELITSEKNEKVQKLPSDTEGEVNFIGGISYTARVEDLTKCLETLETEDIQIITTTLQAENALFLIDAHCKQMSTVAKKKERTYWVGLDKNTSIEAAIDTAKNCNTELGSLVITGATCTNAITGKSEDIRPALLACKMAGIESACNVSMPLTNKVINVSAFDHKYKTSELEELIKNGIVPFGENEEGSLVCIRAITTYQDNSLIQNERSMIRSVLYMDRDLRMAFSRRTGTSSEPSSSEVLQILYNKAKGWYTEGLITKTEDAKFVFNEKVRFDGDKAYLTFDRYVRAPNNFTFITATNRVYSSTIEV